MRRLEAAVGGALARRLDPVLLHYLEDCVGCGICTMVCLYMPIDERYSPVNKAELARRIYRRYFTLAGRVLGPLAGAEAPRQDKVKMLLEHAYACTYCGHCYLVCPFGINSGDVIKLLRSIVDEIGFTPSLLKQLGDMEVKNDYEAFKEPWEEFLREVHAPIAKQEPEVMLGISIWDVLFQPDVVKNMVAILSKAEVDFALSDEPIGIRPPIPILYGDIEGAEEVMRNLAERVEKSGPKKLVLLDGDYPYSTLRYEMPRALRRRPKFAVVHAVELLDELLRRGRLRLKRAEKEVAWHDPCHLGRRGGVLEEPRRILRATANLRELPHNKLASICCGGGGSVAMLSREVYEKLSKYIDVIYDLDIKMAEMWRMATWRKKADMERCGAEVVLTGCWSCVYYLSENAHRRVDHIVNFVAENLA